MSTPVYVKMNAEDQLLLSEGVCRQLGIVSYHPDVFSDKQPDPASPSEDKPRETKDGKVPTIRVKLLNSARLLPNRSTTVAVCVEGDRGGDLLVDVGGEPALIHPDEEGTAYVLMSNTTGFTQKLEKGTNLGEAIEVEVVLDMCPASVNIVSEQSPSFPVEVTIRQQKLSSILEEDLKHLCTEEGDRLKNEILKLHSAFVLEEGERGETDLTLFNIDTGEAQPVKQPARRIPFAVREEVNRQIEAMESTGVIRPSTSAWASPIVLVKKKDGGTRFCIDYRKLNAVTKKDTHPLPRIDDLLDQLGKARYFSTLDLAAGYWQIRMAADSREKTAFVTHRGLYEFMVMPFGLTNAPAAFQRLMQQILLPLNPSDDPEFVNVYIDDVIVFSPTLEEHLGHLQQVISTLLDAGLKLKPNKCHFAREEVEYLGFLVTPGGLKPTNAHIKAVKEFPIPSGLKELRQFLGLASYYRRFVPQFAKIANPLHNLTRKDTPFVWDSECQTAFATLKTRLTTAPVLAYPDFTKGFVLETDASYVGLGAVLSQAQDDGKLHPVSYASRALSAPERNYPITELETLAVVWAISHYRAYLYGHDVVVYTDHSAVKAILGVTNLSGKHARWWTKVYANGLRSIDIVYRSGKENDNADALSRAPVLSPELPVSRSTDPVAEVFAVQSETTEPPSTIPELLEVEDTPSFPSGDLAGEQCKDPSLAPLIDYLAEGTLPSDAAAARLVVAKAQSFSLIDKILYHLDAKQRQVRQAVVPKHLQPRIMHDYHQGRMSGHFSGPRLYRTISQTWWWERMFTDILEFCRSCPQCHIATGAGKPLVPPLHSIPVDRVFQIVGVDIMELPKTSRGNNYVVVFQDFLSKFPLAFPVPDQKTDRLVRLLVDKVIPLFGVPEALLSDRGANLLSHLMKDVCHLLGIKKLNTTSYHPQCDGLVERFNRTLKTMLRKHAADYGVQWDQYLSGVLWAYRNTPHEATGEKPSFLLYGIDCRYPTEAALVPPNPVRPTTVEDYREGLVHMLGEARKQATIADQKAQNRQKRYYDKHAKDPTLCIGDWVLVKFPQEESGRLRKLSRPWHGPYRILSLDLPDATVTKVYHPKEEPLQVHLTRIRPCPPMFPHGFYWYGGTQYSPGKIPQWVQTLLSGSEDLESTPRYQLRSRQPPSVR